MVLYGIALYRNGSDGLREMSVSYKRLLSSVIPTTQEGWYRDDEDTFYKMKMVTMKIKMMIMQVNHNLL